MIRVRQIWFIYHRKARSVEEKARLPVGFWVSSLEVTSSWLVIHQAPGGLTVQMLHLHLMNVHSPPPYIWHR